MYSKTPKILYKILGKPMIQFVTDTAKECGSSEIIVVVGKNFKEVQTVLGNGIKYAIQDPPLGTGDAAKKGIAIASNPHILILYGDVPLLKKDTIQMMIENHFNKGAHLSVLTCRVNNPTGYGRIVRDENRNFLKIVEHSDATDEELKINEINTGIYFGKREEIVRVLEKITPQNRQKEFYLTDIVHKLISERRKVIGFEIKNEEEILGVNTKFDLTRIREILKRNWFEELMKKGVYIEDPATTTIDLTVKIGKFVQIRPFTLIEGNTTINDNEIVGPFVWIKDGEKMVKGLKDPLKEK